jgi:hypothetical protein
MDFELLHFLFRREFPHWSAVLIPPRLETEEHNLNLVLH